MMTSRLRAAALLLFFLAGLTSGGCRYHPEQLDIVAGVQVNLRVYNPDQFPGLTLKMDGRWLDDIDAPANDSELSSIKVMSQTVAAPSWIEVDGTVKEMSFAGKVARPGRWKFDVTGHSAGTEVINYSCEVKVFSEQENVVLVTSTADYCVSELGVVVTGSSPPVIADVSIIGVWTTPRSIVLGTTADVHVQILNEGVSNVTGSVSVTITPPAGGGTNVNFASPFSLPGNNFTPQTITFAWDTAGRVPGAYTVAAAATLDAAGPPDEDAGDNSTTISVPLIVHNVAINSIAATPPAFDAGGATSIDLQVANLGTEEERNISVNMTQIAPGGGPSGVFTPQTRTISRIAAGATTNLNYGWSSAGAVPGVHRLTATIPVLTSGESVTTDNTAFVDTRVMRHDVAITALRAPISSMVNCVEALAVDLSNLGTEAETVSVSVSDTAAATLPPAQNAPLAPQGSGGSTTTLTFDWTPAVAGAHQLSVAAPLAADSNPANNTAAASVNVLATSAAAPTISSITPTAMQAGATAISLTISGSNFACPPTIALQGPQSNNAAITNVRRVDANTISLSLAVPRIGPPQVVWDVVVTNPSGSTATLNASFTVNR